MMCPKGDDLPLGKKPRRGSSISRSIMGEVKGTKKNKIEETNPKDKS